MTFLKTQTTQWDALPTTWRWGALPTNGNDMIHQQNGDGVAFLPRVMRCPSHQSQGAALPTNGKTLTQMDLFNLCTLLQLLLFVSEAWLAAVLGVLGRRLQNKW